MEEPWSFEKKKGYVLGRLYDDAGQTGRNQLWFFPYQVTAGESEYDQTFLYRKEYKHILEVLEHEGLLHVFEYDDKQGHLIELFERINIENSKYVQDGYNTIRDVVLNTDLRESLLQLILRAYGVVDPRELGRKKSIKCDVDERLGDLFQDEKILLLEHLGIAKADWESAKQQTHRPFGNRMISVSFDGEKVDEFTDALTGKKSYIDKKVLKLVAEGFVKIKPSSDIAFWSDVFIEQGVPATLLRTNSPHLTRDGFIYEVLLVLGSTENEQDKQILEAILLETVHPLFYDGDEDVAKKQEQALNKLLKFSNLVLREGRLISMVNEPQQQPSSPNKSIIKAKAIEQLSWLIKDMMTEPQLHQLFSGAGVSRSMVPTDAGSKQKLVYSVLNALSISSNEESKALLFRILEEVGHPLYSGNDMSRAKDTQINLTKIMQYDGLSALGGSIHQFNEDDRVALIAFEEERKKVDPTLAESLSGIFGGSFAPPRVTRQETFQIATHQSTPQQEPRAMHVHIHNDHKITQSIQIPATDQETEHTHVQVETKKSIKDLTIAFDDDLTSIMIDGKNCKLPPHKNEHLFCRAAFEYKKGEPIDWSIVSEKMTGKQWGESVDEGAAKDKRAVMDTMYAINRRVSDVFNTKDQLFAWSEKTVTRMF